MSNTGIKGITQVRSKRTQGYLARVYTNGKTRSKFFGTRKYGGELAACAAASRWLRAQLPAPKKPCEEKVHETQTG